MLELGGVHAGRSSLLKTSQASFCTTDSVDVSKGLFKLLLECVIGFEYILDSIALLVFVGFLLVFANEWLKPVESLSAKVGGNEDYLIVLICDLRVYTQLHFYLRDEAA